MRTARALAPLLPHGRNGAALRWRRAGASRCTRLSRGGAGARHPMGSADTVMRSLRCVASERSKTRMRRPPNSIERIDRCILLTRDHKVMLDSDLARLYAVTTFNLNKARQAQPGPVSGRLHVPVDTEGARRFDIPTWNLKNRPARGTALSAVCLHGTRRGHAVERAAKRESDPSQPRMRQQQEAAAAGRPVGCFISGAGVGRR